MYSDGEDATLQVLQGVLSVVSQETVVPRLVDTDLAAAGARASCDAL